MTATTTRNETTEARNLDTTISTLLKMAEQYDGLAMDDEMQTLLKAAMLLQEVRREREEEEEEEAGE